MRSDLNVNNRLRNLWCVKVSRKPGVVGFLLLGAFTLLLADIFLEVLLHGQQRVQPIVETFVHGLGLVSLLALIFSFFNSINSSSVDIPNIESTSDSDIKDWNSALNEVLSCERTSFLLSPKKLLPLMILSIFVAETAVMLLLNNIHSLTSVQEAVVDSTVLLLFLSPTFFFLHYQPLKQHYQDRMQMLKRLIASEQRFHLAVNAVNDSLWEYTPATDEIFVSPQCEALLGYDPGEVGPHVSSWKSLLHPDDAFLFVDSFNSHLKGETDNIRLEHRMKKKNGSWGWLLTRGQVITRDSEGRALRVIGTHTDITQRKEAESALVQRKEQIRKLSHKLLYVSEEEKKQIAQDLHDEFGQVLTAFQLGLEMLRDQKDGDQTGYDQQFERLFDMVNRLETNLRNVCDELRPVMLDDLGLEETLRWHISSFVPQHEHLVVEQEIENIGQLSREKNIVLYRIFQEALHNVLKHAAATRVRINLENSGDNIVLTVADNGKGFDDGDIVVTGRGSWGLGLLGMRERATAVGGRLEIESSAGKGTLVKVVVPKGSGDKK